ncbi:replication initiator protein A [bacterium]|nr:replication initiator protein A [bacterium]
MNEDNKNENNKKEIKAKEEMNIVEYPFQYLGFKVPPTVKTVEWHGETVTKDGVVRQASWIVTGSDKRGLPRYKDRDVLLALLYFWKLQGFQSETLYIKSINDILRVLRWPKSSATYKELEDSLDRLVGVTIEAKYSFWDNRTKDYLPAITFHLLNYYKFTKEGKRISLTVEAGKHFWESIKSGYIKTVDLDFYLSLETPLAKALFSYLDKKAYQNDKFKIEIMKLAMHLGISLSREYKRIKFDIKETANLLVVKGFLDSYKIEKEGETEFITFYFNREYLTRDVLEQVKEREEKINYLVELMKRELGDGSIETYERIARYYPEEFIYRALGEIREKSRNSDLDISRYRLFKKILKNYIKQQIAILRKNLDI